MDMLYGKVFVYMSQQCIMHHIMNKMNDYQSISDMVFNASFFIKSLYVGRDKSHRTVKSFTVTNLSMDNLFFRQSLALLFRSLGLVRCFECFKKKNLLYSPRLYLSDQKYCKNCNFMKYYYTLK